VEKLLAEGNEKSVGLGERRRYCSRPIGNFQLFATSLHEFLTTTFREICYGNCTYHLPL